MSRRFDVPTYQSGRPRAGNVEKLGIGRDGRHSGRETSLSSMGEPRPTDIRCHHRRAATGIDGGRDRGHDRQCAAARFRGVRPMGAAEAGSPAPDVLRAAGPRAGVRN